jgi:hypothetical protein
VKVFSNILPLRFSGAYTPENAVHPPCASKFGLKAPLSGGARLISAFGPGLAYKNIALRANFYLPLSQQATGAFVKANNGAMIHLSFML